VFFFTYEVRSIPFTALGFVGTLNEQNTFFGIDCSGPGRATFEFITASGVPEFQIEYQFSCASDNRGLGVTLVFPFLSENVTEEGFVTTDGQGSGTYDGVVISFAHATGSGSVTFQGVAEP